MVVCNLCGVNKPLELIQSPFRYVCIECWNECIVIQGESESHTDKEKLY